MQKQTHRYKMVVTRGTVPWKGVLGKIDKEDKEVQTSSCKISKS